MTVGMGLTGIGLLQDYHLRSPELRYFVDYCKSSSPKDLRTDMTMTPNQLNEHFADLISNSYQKVHTCISHLEDGSESSAEQLADAKSKVDELYKSSYQLYMVLKSGNLQLETKPTKIHTRAYW